MIGFPEFILDSQRLDDYYLDVDISNSTYFDNVVSSERATVRRDLKRLRKRVDRTKWDMTPPEVSDGKSGHEK